nr:prepilin-type N-terminal cleavage/methylation domain-containing protein [uncultured Desulfobacter sp.]
MNGGLKKQKSWAQKGFTLIEILIVVIVLGILAMIIIPQITVSTEDAKVSTLSTNLTTLRNAVELYYHQHNNTYPGAHTIAGVASTSDGDSATAFVAQLTKYTDADGLVANVKDAATAPYGPYIKNGKLPTNPFNNKNDVICVHDEDDITVKSSSGDDSGWKFYPLTGNLIPADDAAHDDL